MEGAVFLTSTKIEGLEGLAFWTIKWIIFAPRGASHSEEAEWVWGLTSLILPCNDDLGNTWEIQVIKWESSPLAVWSLLGPDQSGGPWDAWYGGRVGAGVPAACVSITAFNWYMLLPWRWSFWKNECLNSAETTFNESGNYLRMLVLDLGMLDSNSGSAVD